MSNFLTVYYNHYHLLLEQNSGAREPDISTFRTALALALAARVQVAQTRSTHSLGLYYDRRSLPARFPFRPSSSSLYHALGADSSPCQLPDTTALSEPPAPPIPPSHAFTPASPTIAIVGQGPPPVYPQPPSHPSNAKDETLLLQQGAKQKNNQRSSESNGDPFSDLQIVERDLTHHINGTAETTRQRTYRHAPYDAEVQRGRVCQSYNGQPDPKEGAAEQGCKSSCGMQHSHNRKNEQQTMSETKERSQCTYAKTPEAHEPWCPATAPRRRCKRGERFDTRDKLDEWGREQLARKCCCGLSERTKGLRDAPGDGDGFSSR